MIRLLRFAGALAVGGLVVLGTASAAGAAPARPQQTPTTTTVNNGGAQAFSEFAAAERKKQESSTRMIMMAGVLFILAAVAPFAVMKLIPFAEGIDALEGGAKYLSSRPTAGFQQLGTGLNIMSSARGLGGFGLPAPGGGLGGSGSPTGRATFRMRPTGGTGTSPGSGATSASSLGGGVGDGAAPGGGGGFGGGFEGEIDFGGGGDRGGGGGGGGGGRRETPGGRFMKYAAGFAFGGPVGVAIVAGSRAARRKRTHQPRGGAPDPAGS